MANLLACSEEMMEETPDIDSEIAERIRDKRVLSAQLDFSRVQHPPLAFTDHKISEDPRVFQSMLHMEERQVSVPNYFKILQDDITPSMRNSITLWMFEVCDEENMEEPVFLRAVQYMDNFLAMERINRTQFQLLGAVCLLISSKITGTTISPQRLSYYTANSVSPELLLDWEMMILGMLKWDVYGLVSSDFVQHILQRLPKNLWDNEAVTERIKTLTAYCATDHNFGIHLPSIIASACIAAALQPHIGPKSMDEVMRTIHVATNIEMDLLRACIEQIRLKVQLTVEENYRAPGKGPGLTTNSSSMQSCNRSAMATTSAMEEDKLGELSQAGTPTDVADIHF